MIFFILFQLPVVSNVCQNDTVSIHADVESLIELEKTSDSEYI